MKPLRLVEFHSRPNPAKFWLINATGFFGVNDIRAVGLSGHLGLRQDTHASKSQHSSLSISAHACMQVCGACSLFRHRGEHGPKPEDAFLIYRGGGRQRPVDHRLRVCENEGSVQLQEVRCTKVGSHAKPAMREEIARALVQLQLHTLAGFTSLLRDREA